MRCLLSRRPGHPSSPEKMKMYMEDDLTRLLFCVEDDPVAALFYPHFSGDGFGFGKDMADDFLIIFGEVIESCEMVFGDEQDVNRCLGIDILEGKDVFVFIDDSCRNFFPYDLAKDAALRVHWPTL
jgi:hypothetical protein